MRVRLGFALSAVAVAVGAFFYGARTSAAASEAHVQGASVYVPPPPVRTFPSTNPRIQAWISQDAMDSIRAHGWDIWQSINTTTRAGQPVWQTWYSGHELFEMTSGETRAKARANRHGMLEFEVRPLPPGHRPPRAMAMTADGIPYDAAERTFAFNRFSKTTAQFIWRNKLNNGDRLRDTLMSMLARNLPVAQWQVLTSPDSTDPQSFVLKPVYQFISGTEVTAVPVWMGNDSGSTYDPGNPVPSRWRHAIAVDPTGKYKLGDSITMVVNNELPVKLPVVPINQFYYIKITREDSIHFSTFGPVNGDFIGVANDTSAQAVYMAMRPGNIGLLMAMHVTGKEIPNWTWQSYWWALNPADSMGADRPSAIPAPWNHYDMTVAYAMQHVNGTRWIAYNPYLETSLGGGVPTGPNEADTVAWTGVTTNCMSCHRRAAIGWGLVQTGNPPHATVSPTVPPYGPDMYVDAGDSLIFTQPVQGVTGRVPVIKTDFLWSVAIRASLPVATGGPRRR